MEESVLCTGTLTRNGKFTRRTGVVGDFADVLLPWLPSHLGVDAGAILPMSVQAGEGLL